MVEKSQRVLLIEDHALLREAYGRLLAGWGYEYEGAASCAQARSMFRPGDFACALIDLGLPDGHGAELLTEFSRLDPLMVNMILTGDASTDSVIGTMRVGAFDYITKPVNAGVLRQSVQRAMLHYEAVWQQQDLTRQLMEERAQLQQRVEETTHDLRLYAQSCEATNARLSALVRLTQIASSGLQGEEDLFRGVIIEIASFVPIRCLALLDGLNGDFWAAYKRENDELAVVSARGNNMMMEATVQATDADLGQWIRTAVLRHTEANTVGLHCKVFARPLGAASTCTIGMLMEDDFSFTPADEEFLRMCAHHAAAEWQMIRLLQYAARYSSLGTIALEISKSFVKSLSAIQLASDVLEEIVDTPDAAAGLAIIPQNVSLLKDQIREFRSLAQLRKDSIETVRLENIAEQALVVLASGLQERNAEVIREFRTDGSCVLLNGTALQRCFLELISVALRSLTPGGHIRLRLTETDKEWIRFDIIIEQNSGELPGDAKPPLLAQLRARPGFLLAQRALHSCAGRLLVDQGSEGHDMLSIVLPRNATRARLRGDLQ